MDGQTHRLFYTSKALEQQVGMDSTITTTLKALNSDPFEVSNLAGKRATHLISETERYRGDLSVLKMITGGDTLTHRVLRKRKD